MRMPPISRLLCAAQFEQIQFDVEQGLGRVLDPLKVAEYLVAKGIQPKGIEETIQNLDAQFLSQFPAFRERIVLKSTVLPPELPVLLRKKRYKVSGEIWTVHLNDIDPFPSSPHAHNYDQNLVMHLGNGKLYRKRDFVAMAKRKEFLQLRCLIKKTLLPPLENEI